MVIVNIYAPCKTVEKRSLWEKILDTKRNSTIDIWCLIGGFNRVRRLIERKGQESSQGAIDRRAFNYFIEVMEINDIPLVGRNFSWVRPNGLTMSRIDRILVTRRWFDVWKGSCIHVLNRTFSDHCPLILKNNIVDWGPKPFQCLDFWHDDKRFKEFVTQKWEGITKYGRGTYILKEKFKELKKQLVTWNKEQFGHSKRCLKEIEKNMLELEMKGEIRALNEEENESLQQQG